MTYRDRYRLAYDQHHARQYPNAYKNFGAPTVVFPDTRKANGLTRFVVNFLNWSGHNATRISVSGRLIEAGVKQPSGVSLMTKKWIKSSTRKGRADISATIHGRSCQLEIKIGADKPSEHQLAEQQRERSAGGIYEFIGDPEAFLLWYDEFLLTL